MGHSEKPGADLQRRVPQSRPVRKADITAALVARLIAEQFPQWSGLPIRKVAVDGVDNTTFRLGDSMSVRLPSADCYAEQPGKEHRWLPWLAPQLPLPIPRPLAQGVPGRAFPRPWSVYQWIDGEPATADNIASLPRFAADLAAFLAALYRLDPAGGPEPGTHNFHRGGPVAVYDSQTRAALAAFLAALYRLDPAGGPEPGTHNFHRGGPVAVYDSQTRAALAALRDHIDTGLATRVWEAALAADEPTAAVWFHGDAQPGNLLVRDGRLSAVIDFGCAGVGDPAGDTTIAWTFFAGESRDTFRAGLGLDAATWARGRGWAIWKAMIVLVEELPGDPEGAAFTAAVIDSILADHLAFGGA
jgi:aminoglycoside phosphotransferase (APT) family kinase protein